MQKTSRITAGEVLNDWNLLLLSHLTNVPIKNESSTELAKLFFYVLPHCSLDQLRAATEFIAKRRIFTASHDTKFGQSWRAEKKFFLKINVNIWKRDSARAEGAEKCADFSRYSHVSMWRLYIKFTFDCCSRKKKKEKSVSSRLSWVIN